MKKINNYIDTRVCITDDKNVHLFFSVCHVAYVKVSLFTQNSLETIILIIIILQYYIIYRIFCPATQACSTFAYTTPRITQFYNIILFMYKYILLLINLIFFLINSKN